MNTKRVSQIVSLIFFCVLMIQTKEVKADSTSGFWSYEEYEDGTVGITAYSGLDEDIKIPSQIDGKKVVKIAGEAFRNNTNIKTVVIPSTVTTIGHQAFAGSGLTTVTVPETVTTWETEHWVVLPSEEDEYYFDYTSAAFAECANLKTVVFKSHTVPSLCFYGCDSLESVTLGNKTQYINEYAFTNDVNLSKVDVKADLLEIGTWAFRMCESLETIKIGNALTTMGAQAFAGSGLTSVTIPETVITWEEARHVELPCGDDYYFEDVNAAFAACDNLKNVVIKSEKVPSLGFFKCESLSSVTLGEKTQYIGVFAFENDICLSKVDLKADLKEIGMYAFRKCEKLESIDLGDSLSYLGYQAFAGSGLTSVVIPETLVTWEIGTHEELPSGVRDYYYEETSGAFAECKNLKKVVIKTEIVPELCFYGCESLENVTLGKATKYIKGYAFENNSCLKAVYVKNDLLEVGTYAFRCCKKLETIDLGTKLAYIGFQAFANTNLKKVFIPDTVQWEIRTHEEFPSGDDKYYYDDYSGAFAECYNLESVYLGNVEVPMCLLYGSKNVTVYCMKDSSAYNYAIENNLSYKTYDAVPSTDVKLVTKEYTLVKGETLVLHPIMTPMNSTDDITWTTGNEKVATVDSTGLVTANSTGLVAMKCTTSSGKSFSFTINVVASGETTIDNEPTRDISMCIVEGIADKYYTGSAITQDISVRFYPNAELIEGVHYKVSYKNNVNIGTATVTITSIKDSGYTGSIKKTFKVKGFTGMKKVDGVWYYYIDSVVAEDYVGLAQNENGWWYIKNGKLDLTYTGLGQNKYGWWYVKNGKVDRTYTGLGKNQHGWWYVKDGKVDLTYTGMAKNEKGWFYVKNGKLDLTYTGLAENQYGTWYMVNGKVASNISGLTKISKVWMYLSKGKVDTSYVGLAKNESGWWYVKDGKVDLTYTGMAKNQYGWWYVKNGKLDRTYTGLATNQYGTWYMVDGKLANNISGLTKISKVWMYLVKGKVDTDYVGLAKNANDWWYVKNGTVDFTYTGMAKNQYGWWYVTKGQLDRSFTGIASNEYGRWYIKNGAVDKTYTGTIKYNGVTYNIKNGKVN